jgi:hypothetical protein
MPACKRLLTFYQCILSPRPLRQLLFLPGTYAHRVHHTDGQTDIQFTAEHTRWTIEKFLSFLWFPYVILRYEGWYVSTLPLGD